MNGGSFCTKIAAFLDAVVSVGYGTIFFLFWGGIIGGVVLNKEEYGIWVHCFHIEFQATI